MNLALSDFIEQHEEESRTLTNRDYKEIEKIRANPKHLKLSYLFRVLEPFLLPFYERHERNHNHFKL